MLEKRSLRLVIDASVTSAASRSESLPDVTPRRCREFLDAVLEICHRIVLSPSLRDEWKAHRSRYASTWLRSMYARRKVAVLDTDPEHQNLGRSIADMAATEEEASAMEKDLLLIEAALATDLTVISRDDRARSLFNRSAIRIKSLRQIAWANPVTDGRKLMSFLKGEDPAPVFMLGSDLETGEAS